jgi:hypothetical protein
MRLRYAFLAIVLTIASACSDGSPTAPIDSPPPVSATFLKDIVIPNLPSPYYHFEYDATGKVTLASFASRLTLYDVRYANGRISEMQNNIIVNHDRLVYSYDNGGNVNLVSYVDANGVTFTRVHYTYNGSKLVGLSRERLRQCSFVTDKRMSMTYDANGNLFELSQHFPAIAGVQTDANVVDRYEQYDAGTNVDGFGLIHGDFFDHLVLLPQVQLQKNNPRLETRTGDGDNYRVQYTYTYDASKRPLTKSGDATLTNGPNAGQHVQLSSIFTYY